MLKRFAIYIDILTPSHDYMEVLNFFESKIHICEPITRILKEVTCTSNEYDLLIIDYCFLKKHSQQLIPLKRIYEDIICLNVPNCDATIHMLTQNGILFFSKEDSSKVDRVAVYTAYFEKKKLKVECNLWRAVVQNAENSIVLTDPKGNIEFANPFFESVSGYKAEELIEKTPEIIKSHAHDQDFYKKLWKIIKQGDVWEGVFINRHKKGHLFYEEATITPLKHRHGEIQNYLKIGKNVTREKMLLQELGEDVKVASHVLRALMPTNFTSPHLNFEYLNAFYHDIGGDILSLGKLESGQYFFSLIDVMGHGVSSALIAVSIKQIFTDYIRFHTLEETVQTINRFLYELQEKNSQDTFATGHFMVIDPLKKMAYSINAGHLDAIYCSAKHNIQFISSDHMALGIVKEVQYKALEIQYEPLSSFLFFSDGLYENKNMSYEKVLDKLGDIMKKHGSENMLQIIWNEFAADQPHHDDVTLAKITLTSSF